MGFTMFYHQTIKGSLAPKGRCRLQPESPIGKALRKGRRIRRHPGVQSSDPTMWGPQDN